MRKLARAAWAVGYVTMVAAGGDDSKRGMESSISPSAALGLMGLGVGGITTVGLLGDHALTASKRSAASKNASLTGPELDTAYEKRSLLEAINVIAPNEQVLKRIRERKLGKFQQPALSAEQQKLINEHKRIQGKGKVIKGETAVEHSNRMNAFLEQRIQEMAKKEGSGERRTRLAQAENEIKALAGHVRSSNGGAEGVIKSCVGARDTFNYYWTLRPLVMERLRRALAATEMSEDEENVLSAKQCLNLLKKWPKNRSHTVMTNEEDETVADLYYVVEEGHTLATALLADEGLQQTNDHKQRLKVLRGKSYTNACDAIDTINGADHAITDLHECLTSLASAPADFTTGVLEVLTIEQESDHFPALENHIMRGGWDYDATRESPGYTTNEMYRQLLSTVAQSIRSHAHDASTFKKVKEVWRKVGIKVGGAEKRHGKIAGQDLADLLIAAFRQRDAAMFRLVEAVGGATVPHEIFAEHDISA